MTTQLDRRFAKAEKFTLDNKELPVLMQKYPWLAQIAKRTLSTNDPIHLLMIEENLDYAYFILRELAKESLIDMRELDGGFFFDIERFFKLLENYLVHFLDIKRLESKYRLEKSKKRKIETPELVRLEKTILKLCRKFGIEFSVRVLMSIKNWEDEKISFDSASRLMKYTKCL